MITHRILKIDQISKIPEVKLRYPRIRLQGQWLKEAGFNIGGRVKVKAENERIIVELVKEKS